MNRLTDAELEAMRPDLRSPWVNPKMLKAAPAMYAELLERRAMDAVVRDSLAWALGLIDAPSGHSRLVSQRYAERWDAAQAALAKLQETSNG